MVNAVFVRACRMTLLVSLCMLTACAGVKVSSVGPRDYIAARRADILGTGKLSTAASTALHVVGWQARSCGDAFDACRNALAATPGLTEELRQSALAELWLREALRLERQGVDGPRQPVIAAYLEAARHAFAYLFWTERPPERRALEERQGQVRDYYNFAVQQAATNLFADLKQQRAASAVAGNYLAGRWRIAIRAEQGIADDPTLPDELIPAPTLTFEGVRNQYRRDGVGAALVAVSARTVVANGTPGAPYRATPFASATAIVSFPGATLGAVLATSDVELTVYDPYLTDQVTLARQAVPLAADFTAGYGLWLARSGFGAESVRTLLGHGEVLDRPRVYLMQPYDPHRRTVVMLHGLASSPEAWINVANEVMGDEALRRGYQVWQVYYPTNVPIPVNNVEIRAALADTFRHFDPDGTALASQQVVLVGHSMGGLLARLMVSDSGPALLQGVLQETSLSGKRLARATEKLRPYTEFSPLPQVGRAVFIAAPQRGTPFAQSWPARLAAHLVAVPAALAVDLKEVADLLANPASSGTPSPLSTANGIRNLSDNDPFIQAAGALPIPATVPYHSIIANDTPGVALQDANDGLVPYRSAHQDGAQSELVIQSGHSVQETPGAILEVRRILKLHLDGLPAQAAAPD
jgi:pimeloyl-ACP methyl ester carboxylesterase